MQKTPLINGLCNESLDGKYTMKISDLPALSFMLLLGSSLIYLGISGVFGYRRDTYIFPSYLSGGVNYAALPGGTAFLLLVIGRLTPEGSFVYSLFQIVAGILMLLGVLWTFTQPTFLTPKWLRWLRENSDDISPWIIPEIEAMGYANWKERTKTQVGLEEWVAEVREKHKDIKFVPSPRFRRK